jgi:hypothetical protein
MDEGLRDAWRRFLAANRAERQALLAALTPAQIGRATSAMSVDDRTHALGRLDRDELAGLLAKLPPPSLVAIGRQAVRALGPYRAKLTKRERVGETMLEAQVLELAIREAPRAVRITFSSGPSAGRRVLYNEELRRDEVRVKEAGVLGMAGAVWLHLDNPLTRRDTNHRVTEIGLESLLALIEKDMRAGESAGGHARQDVGWDPRGRYHLRFTAPEGATGLYARTTDLTLDPLRSIPVHVDVADEQGPLESFEYADVEPTPIAADFFSLKAAKL